MADEHHNLLSDLLPDHERVRYRHVPLKQVVVQVRFDPLVEIGASAPVDFHRAIRPTFPLYQEQRNFSVLPGGGDNARMETTHLFQSRENNAKVTLSSSALAVETPDYEGFEEFRAWFTTVLGGLDSAYSPGAFTRIGLRYIDVIPVPGPWGLPLRDAISRDLLGPHLADVVGPHVRDSLAALNIDMGGSTTTLRHGLQLSATDEGEVAHHYLIDTDHWRQEVLSAEQLDGALQGLHAFAWRFFRWCITKELHDALGPEPI